VALLRGVNLGGHNKVPMGELRDVVASLGFDDVSTFIQSGNVLFTSRATVTPNVIEGAVRDAFGIDCAVMLRTSDELARVVKANPFPHADASRLHVGFLAAKASAAKTTALDHDAFAPEEFAVIGAHEYLHLPNGMGRSKLPGYLERRLGIPTTIRTWSTVTKLLDLARG
jgi:uncharacterized protein (DUF1697 family)